MNMDYCLEPLEAYKPKPQHNDDYEPDDDFDPYDDDCDMWKSQCYGRA
ncbi:hypothetical protein ACT2CV_01235 [Pasteurellaceae bacterium 22721_9_1]